MDKHTKELVAVGAAVAANCQPCLQLLVEAAREGGACEEDIMVAIAVGSKVRNGAASKMDGFVAGMFKEIKDCASKVESPCGCGCG